MSLRIPGQLEGAIDGRLEVSQQNFPVSILCPNGTGDEGSAGGEAGFRGVRGGGGPVFWCQDWAVASCRRRAILRLPASGFITGLRLTPDFYHRVVVRSGVEV